ncbi:hypothetical protein KNV57_gp71 [uncultured phage cr124_1]|uniref:Uncharacterized protein n=2 Tax=Caudoviricetes TaxID=2731619 RepID=A0A7M1RU74_9CAUD|nr:hypothetical protein KNV57_gp71 [uncultured phage cr124_1]QOR57451.1 hypothetical protein [uncultured phage cr124_1]DAD95142.1 MAG TPA: hypothetical protein [Podoviridae sp. ctsNK10]
MSKKNNKKNLKKVQAKIGTTPVKAEAAKKEESKAAIKNAEIAAAKDDVKAKKKAEKKAHEEAKYAASKARIEARKARKKSIMNKLIDSKKEKASEPVKITLEDRLKKQEERRNVAMARHIASITRRCKRMHLNDADTKKVIDIAKKQWDNATVYNITVVCDSILKKKKELEKLVKDCGIKSACITNSTAFFKNVPASVVAKLRDLVGNATFYQYRSDDKSPFEEAGIDMSGNHNKHKKGGDPHTIECSKNASVNFYNLRKAKKKAKETLEKNTYNFRHGSKAEGRKLRRELKVKAKAVNKKPTQVKEIKQKTAKQAA